MQNGLVSGNGLREVFLLIVDAAQLEKSAAHVVWVWVGIDDLLVELQCLGRVLGTAQGTEHLVAQGDVKRGSR